MYNINCQFYCEYWNDGCCCYSGVDQCWFGCDVLLFDGFDWFLIVDGFF